MSWNYRIMHTKLDNGEDRYWIGEAYYKKGKFDGGYSEAYEGMLESDTVEDLKETLALIQEAAEKPILEVEAKSE